MQRQDVLRRGAANPPHVVHQVLVDQLVLLDLKTGRYHGLPAVAARFWEAIGAAERIGDVVAPLAQEYGQAPERIEADLVAFVEDLLAHDLLELR